MTATQPLGLRGRARWLVPAVFVDRPEQFIAALERRRPAQVSERA